MTSLGTFNVAHNNLSGTIPDRKNQFRTFEESSYEGTPLLCGPPLHNSWTKMLRDHEVEEGGCFMDMGFFYVSFVVAYIIMLLEIVTVLYINSYWCRVWFNLIELCIDTLLFYCDSLPLVVQILIGVGCGWPHWGVHWHFLLFCCDLLP